MIVPLRINKFVIFEIFAYIVFVIQFLIFTYLLIMSLIRHNYPNY